MDNTTVSALVTLQTNVGQFLSVFLGIVVLFMQCGFALYEAGLGRSKNATFILVKNMMMTFVSMLAFWLFGYAFAFGNGFEAQEFIGAKHFASHDLSESSYGHFFFQFTFAATTSTIVAGALSERCRFFGYVVVTFFLSGFIYPVTTHWAWGGGWLYEGMTYTDVGKVAYQDFAGSGTVHILAGVMALVGCIILGRRSGRYEREIKLLSEMRGHSSPIAAIGGFILFFGFLAFNGGSQFMATVPGAGNGLGLAVANTVIAGAFGCFAVLFFNKIRIFKNSWSLKLTVNGALVGMVAAGAGCNQMYPWGACVLGVIAGFSYCCWSGILRKLRVDDPLDTVAVHLGGGLWGTIAIAFLDKNDGILIEWNQRSGYKLAWQLCGTFAIFGWGLFFAFFLFATMRAFGVFRVSRDIEEDGFDVTIHDEPAYPIEAYGNGQMEEILRILQNENSKRLSQVFDNQAYTGPPYDSRRFDDNGSSGNRLPKYKLRNSVPAPRLNYSQSQKRDTPYQVYNPTINNY